MGDIAGREGLMTLLDDDDDDGVGVVNAEADVEPKPKPKLGDGNPLPLPPGEENDLPKPKLDPKEGEEWAKPNPRGEGRLPAGKGREDWGC